MTLTFGFGFRILGPPTEPRRLVDAARAFAAYAECDERAECDREGYLSAFQFGPDFRQRADEWGRLDVAGFAGPCWSPWLWFDLDSEDLGFAHKDAGSLAVFLVERYAVEPADLLAFFSGAKGFHLAPPTALWSPAPSVDFHRVCRRFAENVAELAAVTIDVGIYDKVRPFRAPNSRHAKTGLHKVRLTFEELLGPLDAILERARTPAPFSVPTPRGRSDQAAADWAAAVARVQEQSEAKAARRAAGNGSPTLNRGTLDFIRNGADRGDRHRLLFSSAANLGEFHCPPALAHALLSESALDSGLPPKEVCRQIECGLAAVKSDGAKTPVCEDGQDSPTHVSGNLDAAAGVPSANVGPEKPAAAELQGQLAALWAAPTPGATAPTPPAAGPPAPTPLAAGLEAELAKLWGRAATPADADQGPAADPPPKDRPKGPAVLPPDPPALEPVRPPRGCPGGCEWADDRVDRQAPNANPDPAGPWIRTACRRCGRLYGYRPAGKGG